MLDQKLSPHKLCRQTFHKKSLFRSEPQAPDHPQPPDHPQTKCPGQPRPSRPTSPLVRRRGTKRSSSWCCGKLARSRCVTSCCIVTPTCSRKSAMISNAPATAACERFLNITRRCVCKHNLDASGVNEHVYHFEVFFFYPRPRDFAISQSTPHVSFRTFQGSARYRTAAWKTEPMFGSTASSLLDLIILFSRLPCFSTFLYCDPLIATHYNPATPFKTRITRMQCSSVHNISTRDPSKRQPGWKSLPWSMGSKVKDRTRIMTRNTRTRASGPDACGLCLLLYPRGLPINNR